MQMQRDDIDIVLIGNAILKDTTKSQSSDQFFGDSYADIISITNPEILYNVEEFEVEEISDDDIINYLMGSTSASASRPMFPVQPWCVPALSSHYGFRARGHIFRFVPMVRAASRSACLEAFCDEGSRKDQR